MLVLVTRMSASVGALICGSGTVSTETLRRPCQVTARMGSSSHLGSRAACPLVKPSNTARNDECKRPREAQLHQPAVPDVVERHIQSLAGRRFVTPQRGAF